MTQISPSGPFTIGSNAAKVTFSPDLYLLFPRRSYIDTGWPSWSYPYTHPVKFPYTQTLEEQFNKGEITLVVPIPFPLSVSPGNFNLGYGGSVSISTDWRNTFSDFALWVNPSGSGYSSVDLDPSSSPIIQGWQNQSASTPTGYYGGDSYQPWTTLGATLIPPRGAKYVAPKIGVQTASGAYQFLTYIGLSTLPLSDIQDYNISGGFPTPTYEYPRALIVKPVPDRLNISVSPTGKNLVTAGCTSSTGPSYNGTISTTITVTDSDFTTVESQNIQVEAGEVYTYSFSYQTTADSFSMEAQFLNGSLQLIDIIQSDPFPPTGSDWGVASMTFTVPDGAFNMQVSPVVPESLTNTGSTISITELLLEESSVVGTWFDGDSGDGYSWQSGETAGESRSYYYDNQSVRQQILDRVLLESTPLWLTLIDTQFSNLSYLPVNLGSSGGVGSTEFYGFGYYSSGPYGG